MKDTNVIPPPTSSLQRPWKDGFIAERIKYALTFGIIGSVIMLIAIALQAETSSRANWVSIIAWVVAVGCGGFAIYELNKITNRYLELLDHWQIERTALDESDTIRHYPSNDVA